MDLIDILTTKKTEVMDRWRANVVGTIAPEAMRPVELLDHLPTFVDEIASALREDAGLSPNGPLPEESPAAAVHGEQRLRLGFSLDAVVREYGALRDAIVATARDAGAQPTFRELNVLSNAMISGIAHAVTEYAQQRDAQLLRLANEHFAFIAHELRNPLSSAIIALELLKQQGALPTEGRAVRALERGLKQTTSLVDQTLKIARIASGIELRRQPTTIQALLEDAELEAMSEAEAKGIELRMVVAEDAQVLLDRRLVGSAVGNLLRNGVKYSHQGSVVEVRGTVSNGRVVIEIEDGCGGLSPGHVEAAFAPFVRLDERQSGFGLGLAIAKQAVDAHGGTIRVQNLPKKGCIFVLELPAS
jgi:signal transduction histidine kinase